MGCSGSTQMVPATSDVSLKPSSASISNSIPKEELVLKDLPDVVEKVLDSIKESELKKLDVESTESSNSIVSKEETLPIDKNDTNNKCSTHEVTQPILLDMVSSITSKQSEADHLDEINKSKNKNTPSISSDADSLRTSSPESEIEQALANNNDQNPPTPKPTFSELQNLVVGPVNTIIKSYVTKTEIFTNELNETKPTNENSDKSEENNIPIIRKDPTEWEKQADLLALTQKYNPIEAMRKFRRDNVGERNGSGLILKNEFKPKVQNIFEDLNEFLPLQSPHRSRISSAKSERSQKIVCSSSELDEKEQSSKNDNADVNKKYKEKEKEKELEVEIEVKPKKSPEHHRKQKDSYLVVPTNVRGVPSPSPHKVRERCAVCCNKYKH